MGHFKGNKLVDLVDELHICGCGCPENVYRAIRDVLADPIKCNEGAYYDYMLYQLNHLGYLDHGSSIYGSFVTEKGKELLKAFDEMAKYDYDYQEFLDNNLIYVEDQK